MTPERTTHFIVLMLENRSFDHLLGRLPHSNINYPRLSGTESNPSSAGLVRVDDVVPSIAMPADPAHSHRQVVRQLGGLEQPRHNGFVHSFEEALRKKKKNPVLARQVMSCLTPDQVPVLSTLALEFAVCTRWFASVPGETWPNRNFAHAATSHGFVDIEWYKKALFGDRTIFEDLEEDHRSWRVYGDGFDQVMLFPKLSVRHPFRFKPVAQLIAAIRNNVLDDYSFVEPTHGGRNSSSQHPSNNIDGERDFLAGERLIHDIYDALRNSPEVFRKTVFLITYDEHGGFFDREGGDKTEAPDHYVGEFLFTRLGVRVPAVIVSPWIPKGWVDRHIRDHASIPRTIRECVLANNAALRRRFLTGRESWANPFHTILSLPKVRPDNDWPLTRPRAIPTPPDAQQLLVQETPWEADPFEQAMLAGAYAINKLVGGALADGSQAWGTAIPDHEVEVFIRSVGTPEAATLFMQAVGERVRNSFDSAHLELVTADGRVVIRPSEEEIEGAIAAVLESTDQGTRVFLRSAEDRVAIATASGSYRAFSLKGSAQTDQGFLPMVEQDTGRVSARNLTRAVLAAVGRPDLWRR